MVNDESGVRTARESRIGMAVLVTVMLAMLMTYSMVLIHWGGSWQVAVAIPVSLATTAVHLVRQVFGAGIVGGRLRVVPVVEECGGLPLQRETPARFR